MGIEDENHFRTGTVTAVVEEYSFDGNSDISIVGIDVEGITEWHPIPTQLQQGLLKVGLPVNVTTQKMRNGDITTYHTNIEPRKIN